VSLAVGEPADAIALADAVRERGVLAMPACPPMTPPGNASVRFTPMATHDRVDIEDCIHAVRDAASAPDAD
jgi:8-amino-7-oxononanoate synthase